MWMIKEKVSILKFSAIKVFFGKCHIWSAILCTNMKTFDTRLGFGNDVIQYADAIGGPALSIFCPAECMCGACDLPIPKFLYKTHDVPYYNRILFCMENQ